MSDALQVEYSISNAGDLNRILLVDGSGFNAKVTTDWLENASMGRFQVDWASNVQEGQELLQIGRFDVVIIDENLPDGRGKELVDYTKSIGLQIPFIFVVEDDPSKMVNLSLQSDVSDFVPKTDHYREVLMRAIDYAIEQQRHVQDIHENEMLKGAVQTNNAIAKKLLQPVRALILELDYLSTQSSQLDPRIIQQRISDARQKVKVIEGYLSTLILATKIAGDQDFVD